LPRLLRSTLGPVWAHVILDTNSGARRITKEGVNRSKRVELEDPNENRESQLVPRSCFEDSIRRDRHRGHSSCRIERLRFAELTAVQQTEVPLQREGGKGRDAGVAELAKISKKVSEPNRNRAVATVSPTDVTIGEIMPTAMDKFVKMARLHVEEPSRSRPLGKWWKVAVR